MAREVGMYIELCFTGTHETPCVAFKMMSMLQGDDSGDHRGEEYICPSRRRHEIRKDRPYLFCGKKSGRNQKGV
jgi:hypothetical protein